MVTRDQASPLTFLSLTLWLCRIKCERHPVMPNMVGIKSDGRFTTLCQACLDEVIEETRCHFLHVTRHYLQHATIQYLRAIALWPTLKGVSNCRPMLNNSPSLIFKCWRLGAKSKQGVYLHKILDSNILSLVNKSSSMKYDDDNQDVSGQMQGKKSLLFITQVLRVCTWRGIKKLFLIQTNRRSRGARHLSPL